MQLELRDYFNVLVKRWWLILLVAAGAAAGGYGYSKLQTPIYQADVKIQAFPSRADNGLIEYLVKNLPSYTAGLDSHEFVNSVLTDSANRGHLDDLTADDVLGKLKVQAQPDNHIIDMTVDDPSAQKAADIANALASAYADQQNALAEKSQSADKIFLQQLDTARPPPRPYQPRTLLNTGAAALLGLVLGLILAFILEFTDTSLKTSEDVQRYLALNTIGLIPARKRA
ncbi:MAG: YveK family protein [Chloroflexia bacterium]